MVAILSALPRPPSVSTVHRRIRAKYDGRSWTVETRFSSLQVSKATTLETRGKILTHLQYRYLVVNLPTIPMP
jgi:hypothetical protein